MVLNSLTSGNFSHLKFIWKSDPPSLSLTTEIKQTTKLGTPLVLWLMSLAPGAKIKST